METFCGARVRNDLLLAYSESQECFSNVDKCVCLCNWQADYYYEYTECDSTGSRWRVAIPQRPGACTGLPEPVRGTECSKYSFDVRILFIYLPLAENSHHYNLTDPV